MPSPIVAILTESRYETLDPEDWYHVQIQREDGLLADALGRLGIHARRVAWSAPEFDWAGVDAAIFRTTWDYFHRFSEFSQWMERAARLTRLINSPALVRWNIDKHYLADLARRGVAIPPTRFIEPGTAGSLSSWLADSCWPDAILKPAISGTARHTYRVSAGNCAAHEDVFRSLIETEAMLLQPFVPGVLDEGEISLAVIGGHCTHAVRKTAKPGDFRVQDDHGGTVHPHTPAPDEIAFAESAVRACPEPPLYARVDAVHATGGQLLLMELEVVEPELFLRFHPAAADTLASAIATAIATPLESTYPVG